MRGALIFLSLVLAAAGGGWWLAPAPESPSPGGRATGQAERLEHGGRLLAAAARRLEALGIETPPPAAEPVDTGVAADPAPPPVDTLPVAAPDIAEQFRRALSAIEQTPSGPVVWVVDLNADRGRRAIAPGGVFADGWRVSDIKPQTIDLRRGQDSRRVVVFDALQQE